MGPMEYGSISAVFVHTKIPVAVTVFLVQCYICSFEAPLYDFIEFPKSREAG